MLLIINSDTPLNPLSRGDMESRFFISFEN